MKNSYLYHPADAKFRAFGQTLDVAFANAALALASCGMPRIALKLYRAVEVTGIDLQQLLMVFLEEILFLLDARNFLLETAEKVKICEGSEGYTLQAVFEGESKTD